MAVQSVVFDFDGVIHQYKHKPSTWDETLILDPPVEGIREAVENIKGLGYKVIVVSARARSEAGRAAIRTWLDNYGIVVDEVTDKKPPAKVYIDDRAICFDGKSDKLVEKIQNFKPWNR